MADMQLSNPAGINGEQWQTTQTVEEYLYDPEVSSSDVLTNGMVVIISGGWDSTNGDQTSVTSTEVPVIRISTTIAAFTNVGVVVNAPTNGYVPGDIVQVCTRGIAQILCDANDTVYGELLVAGSTTPGAATIDSAAVVGETIATCLQTLTISSGTALVYGYVGIR